MAVPTSVSKRKSDAGLMGKADLQVEKEDAATKMQAQFRGKRERAEVEAKRDQVAARVQNKAERDMMYAIKTQNSLAQLTSVTAMTAATQHVLQRAAQCLNRLNPPGAPTSLARRPAGIVCLSWAGHPLRHRDSWIGDRPRPLGVDGLVGPDDDVAADDRAVLDAVRGGLPRPVFWCPLCNQSRHRPDLHFRPCYPILPGLPEWAREGLHMGQDPAVDTEAVPPQLVLRRPPLGSPILDHRHGGIWPTGRRRQQRRSREPPPRSSRGTTAATD